MVNKIVLGIETSCDETGIALYDSNKGLLSDVLHSQVAIHQEYGGVVPELASRDHSRRIIPLIRRALQQAGIGHQAIGGIAYTRGPGLMGALMVGACTGKALAWAWNVPAIGVHHMEGHLLAPLLEAAPPAFPFLALLVSGGHTQLVHVAEIGHYQLLGESLDDAAGEAFDKVATLLGLPYPGGPAISQLAQTGVSGRFQFPRPMTDRPGLDFSFSGLKTFALNTIRQCQQRGALGHQDQADIAKAFETAVVDTLVIKCQRALQQTGLTQLVIAGGVSANQPLRQALGRSLAKANATLHYARPALCTDNGAMIAYAGCQRLLAGQREDLAIVPMPRWSLADF